MVLKTSDMVARWQEETAGVRLWEDTSSLARLSAFIAEKWASICKVHVRVFASEQRHVSSVLGRQRCVSACPGGHARREEQMREEKQAKP